MFICPKCNHETNRVTSKVCPNCSLRYFDEELTTWIGSSDECNIVISKSNIPEYSAVITFNKEVEAFELINLVNDELLIYKNQKEITTKDQITTNDWMEISGIILDFNHPKIYPLFNLNVKVNLKIDFEETEIYKVGNTENCEIYLPDMSKEIVYAHIIKSKNNYFCAYPEDLENINKNSGIFINDYKLKPDEIKLIDENDNIYIEDIKLPLGQIPCFLDDKQPYFLTEKFPIEFEYDSFEDKNITIGLSNCDIVLVSQKISMNHLSIRYMENDLFRVRDNNSYSGTYINNKKIEEALVTYNQYVSFGDFQLKLINREDRTFIHIDHIKGKTRIDVVNISKKVKDFKSLFTKTQHNTLLNNISLSIDAGEFIGIMGPSGSGKTTLLKVLAGVDRTNQNNISGNVYFNYHDLETSYSKYRNDIAYLPQDDILFPDLTVYQCLKYSSKLRLPNLPDDNINSLIDNVLINLDLAKRLDDGTFDFSIKDRKIGDINKPGAISGGQRKRINLAIELLSDPSIIFLDEPTSGLSSVDSINLINLLSNICNAGNTLITTIHQPSNRIFQKFNKIVILARNGELAYFGSTQRVVEYFESKSGIKKPNSSNPATFILEALETKEPDYWSRTYNDSEHHEFYVKRTHSKMLDKITHSKSENRYFNPISSFNLNQFYTLVKRNFALKINNLKTISLLMLQAPIIALLLGIIFSGFLNDGPKLPDNRPEEDLSRMEDYFRPNNAKYLPPFDEDIKIINRTVNNLYLYTQRNDVQDLDTFFYKRINNNYFSYQELFPDDKINFPIKTGNYKLIISDMILDKPAMTKLFKVPEQGKNNIYYYNYGENDDKIALNDWNDLIEEQKNTIWNEKVLPDRAVRFSDEDSLFAKYAIFEAGPLSFANHLFEIPGFFNNIKKYYFTVENEQYSWFENNQKKSILYSGEKDYNEKVLRNLYLIFLAVISFIWIGMTNTVKDIVLERQIYLRERRYTLKVFNYVSSKFFTLLSVSLIQTAVFIFVVSLFVPDIPINIWLFSLVLLLTALVSGGIGIIVSSVSRTIEFSISMLPLLLIPQIVLAGIFKHNGAMSDFVKFLSTLTVSRWSLEGLTNAISMKVDFESPFINYVVPFKSILFPCYYPTIIDGKTLTTGYFPFIFELDFLILLGFLLITFGLSYFILRMQKK